MSIHEFRRPNQPRSPRRRNPDALAWAAFLGGAVVSVLWRLLVSGPGGGTLIGLLAAVGLWLALTGGAGGGRGGPVRRY
jgi:uncharacterized membrane protein